MKFHVKLFLDQPSTLTSHTGMKAGMNDANADGATASADDIDNADGTGAMPITLMPMPDNMPMGGGSGAHIAAHNQVEVIQHRNDQSQDDQCKDDGTTQSKDGTQTRTSGNNTHDYVNENNLHDASVVRSSVRLVIDGDKTERNMKSTVEDEDVVVVAGSGKCEACCWKNSD
jgi:hypothetical protein